MSLVTIPYIFSVGNTIIASQHNSNFSVIFNDYNGNITDANIASNAAIEYTKLALNNSIQGSDISSTTVINGAGQVSGASLTSLSSIPSGAGTIPSANLAFGTVVTGLLNGTVYHATQDGFAFVSYNAGGSGYYLVIYCDSNSSPSTIRAKSFFGSGDHAPMNPIQCLVKVGQYYQIQVLDGTFTPVSGQTGINAAEFWPL
jgi:hypothetical protein